MIKWLINNKEWVFSGIGVPIVVGFILFIKRKLSRKNKEVQEADIYLNESFKINNSQLIPAYPSKETFKVDGGESIPIERVGSLSFSEIEQTIEKTPPLQRDEVKKNFIGIRVMWDGYLKGASSKDNDIVSLMLAPGPKVDDKACTIWCKVSLNDYRELGILSEGARIKIQGEIKKADLFDVELINVKLFFLKN